MDVSDINILLELFGYLLRPLGALVFGLAAGWLTVRTAKLESMGWQFPLAAVLGLFAAFVLIGHFVPGGGTLGAFGLGAGAGVLIWGMVGGKKAKPEDED